MRDGNASAVLRSSVVILVGIVPMRDGNPQPYQSDTRRETSWDCPYEGWKPVYK